MALIFAILLVSSFADRDHDGFPDTAEIRSGADRYAFREWLCAIALAEYLQPSGAITDCADLVRFAYREALKVHDNRWFARTGLQIPGAMPDIGRFNYPEVPLLGTRIFRVRSGPFQESDLATGGFSNFADVKNLLLYNTVFLGRLPTDLHDGDLLFFYQREDQSYHLMIYLTRKGIRYLLYHTGPEEKKPGELRLIEFKTLVDFPARTWRPIPQNSAFLGFYRFKIVN